MTVDVGLSAGDASAALAAFVFFLFPRFDTEPVVVLFVSEEGFEFEVP